MKATEERIREIGREKSRLEEIRRLEELWAVSPAPAPVGLPRRRTRFAPLIIPCWIVFLAVLFVLPPPPESGTTTPLWADLLAVGMLLSLFATLSGFASPRSGYAASAFAATFGMALAVGCFATGHHPGFWPVYELVGFAVLAGVSGAGFVRASRRD